MSTLETDDMAVEGMQLFVMPFVNSYFYNLTCFNDSFNRLVEYSRAIQRIRFLKSNKKYRE